MRLDDISWNNLPGKSLFRQGYCNTGVSDWHIGSSTDCSNYFLLTAVPACLGMQLSQCSIGRERKQLPEQCLQTLEGRQPTFVWFSHKRKHRPKRSLWALLLESLCPLPSPSAGTPWLETGQALSMWLQSLWVHMCIRDKISAPVVPGRHHFLGVIHHSWQFSYLFFHRYLSLPCCTRS